MCSSEPSERGAVDDAIQGVVEKRIGLAWVTICADRDQ